MSAVTKAIGLAKKLKHRYQDELRARTPVYLSPVRRIDQVRLPKRICAMTFDDGPCRLPANPSKDGKPLTLSLLESLEQYGARGTFDIVGDTSENYPDKPGKEGSASWGGVKFDHYPDIHKDADGGAVHCPELVQRIFCLLYTSSSPQPAKARAFLPPAPKFRGTGQAARRDTLPPAGAHSAKRRGLQSRRDF